MSRFKIGDKVTHVYFGLGTKKGIVKSLDKDGYIFVVYEIGKDDKGNDDWNNYKNYIAQRSDEESLVLGWIEKK